MILLLLEGLPTLLLSADLKVDLLLKVLRLNPLLGPGLRPRLVVLLKVLLDTESLDPGFLSLLKVLDLRDLEDLSTLLDLRWTKDVDAEPDLRDLLVTLLLVLVREGDVALERLVLRLATGEGILIFFFRI